MDKEELKELLEDLPDGDYLEKLIKAMNLFLRAKDDLPDEDTLNKLLSVPGSEFFDALPDEDTLDKLNSVPGSGYFDALPDEGYLDKIIQAGKVSLGD